MNQNKRVVILGGHGKIALLTAPKLVAENFQVDSVIRNPEHQEDVTKTGAKPIVLDLEKADVQEFTKLFSGADAIVFSAGAGGGNPKRTNSVDFEAATKTIQAAEKAGVKRFVMVSYAGSGADLEKVPSDSSFYPYVVAKSAADDFLRKTALDYTILGPGKLTLEPATNKIRVLAGSASENNGRDQIPADERVTSRDNTAAVIAHVIKNNVAIRQTVNFYDGDKLISNAI